MREGVIAARYAKALMQVASSENAEQRIYDELSTYSKLLAMPALRLSTIYANPAVPREEKRLLTRALGELFSFNTHLRTVLELLINRNRIQLVPLVFDAYQNLLDMKLGQLRAKVTVATRIAEDELLKVQQAIETCFRKKALFSVTHSEVLIAGIKVEVDDFVIDASLDRQLENMRARLMQ